MINNITSFSRSGMFDWLVMRISAVLLGIYFVFLLGFFITHPNLTFEQWHGLFSNKFMQISTLLASFLIVAHCWIGIWAVTTDYLTERLLGRYAIIPRLGIQILTGLLLFVFVVFVIQMLWGV